MTREDSYVAQSPAPTVRVEYRDDATRERLHSEVERSVATLAARAEARLARARAAEHELDKLAAALDAPLVALLQNDPSACQASERLRRRQLVEPEPSGDLSTGSSAPPTTLTLSGDPVLRTLATYPPYDFRWAWHDTNGHAPYNTMLVDATARAGLDARSGLLDGGASGFVAAHAGFGVVLRTDHPATRTGGAVVNQARFSFVMRAVGVGSNATTEGGLELTALEDGRLIASTSDRLWRKKISAGESASGGPGSTEYRPSALRFAMQPGRQYTFNVGIWVFTDRSTGVGGAAVQALFEGNVSSLWVAG
jgi:hypothetical protein